MKQAIRRMLYRSPLYFPIRSAYQRVFSREYVAKRHRMRALYRQFFNPGDTVFDVGANNGIYAHVFASLGAKVIAVEPHPGCFADLLLLSKRCSVVPVNAVADSQPGTRRLHMAEFSEQSTLSDSVDGPIKWLGDVEVPAVTLDHLASLHGTPSFVKIDVEGFEGHVFAGMSFLPKALSFEFNKAFPGVADSCLQMPFMGEYEFNFTRAEEMALVSPQWLTVDALREKLPTLSAPHDYGDVIARLAHQ